MAASYREREFWAVDEPIRKPGVMLVSCRSPDRVEKKNPRGGLDEIKTSRILPHLNDTNA